MSEVVTAGFGVSHPVSLLPTVPIMSSRDCPELTLGKRNGMCPAVLMHCLLLDVDSSSDVMATIQVCYGMYIVIVCYIMFQRILIKPALLDEDLSRECAVSGICCLIHLVYLEIQLCLSTLCQHLHRAVSPLPNLYCQQVKTLILHSNYFFFCNSCYQKIQEIYL